MALTKEEVITYARQAYGDLLKPDYSFFSEAWEQQPWRPVVDELRQFLRVEDWTNGNDDVSFSYVLQPPRRFSLLRRERRPAMAWTVWLSAVGPFALFAGGPADTELVREEVIVEPRPDGPAEEARVVEILKKAGVKLLSAEDVEQTVVEFRPWDGRFPASVFVVLFSDTDVPWWHAY